MSSELVVTILKVGAGWGGKIIVVDSSMKLSP